VTLPRAHSSVPCVERSAPCAESSCSRYDRVGSCASPTLPVGETIGQLTAATDAMTGAISERTSNRGRRSGATVGIKERLSAGRKIVHILDAFVKSALKDDPSLLRNWSLVKRVPRPTGRGSAPMSGSFATEGFSVKGREHVVLTAT